MYSMPSSICTIGMVAGMLFLDFEEEDCAEDLLDCFGGFVYVGVSVGLVRVWGGACMGVNGWCKDIG